MHRRQHNGDLNEDFHSCRENSARFGKFTERDLGSSSVAHSPLRVQFHCSFFDAQLRLLEQTNRHWLERPRIARASVTLMRRAGYMQFVAQGGDWCAITTEQMDVQAAPELLGYAQ